MEKNRNTKHHDKHGQQRPRDAYELYELEHMPHTLVKVPSDRAKPRGPDYHETGRSVQRNLHPPTDGDGGICKESIDAKAEEFIMLKHEKFELSKWMSMNGY